MRHVYECPVRRADLHPGGTVNNVAYVDYLQEARLDVLRRHDSAVSARPGEGLVVVGTVVEYLRPITLAARPLFVASWVTEVRAASFTLGYELFTRPAQRDAPVVHAPRDDLADAVRLRPGASAAAHRRRAVPAAGGSGAVSVPGPRPPAAAGALG